MDAVRTYEIGSVDREEVLSFLGYAGQDLSGDLDDRLDQAVARCVEVARPRGCVRVFDVSERGEKDGVPFVALDGTALSLVGRSIAAHLDGAVAVGVLAVTAGMGVDAELRRLSLTDQVAGVIFDAAGSALVERVADAAEADVAARGAELGLFAGPRFSPGYGDLPLSTQPVLLSTLDAQRLLGITLSDSLLMAPSKSVTAVVGLFREPPSRDYAPCDECLRREFCELRARGRFCGGMLA